MFVNLINLAEMVKTCGNSWYRATVYRYRATASGHMGISSLQKTKLRSQTSRPEGGGRDRPEATRLGVTVATALLPTTTGLGLLAV